MSSATQLPVGGEQIGLLLVIGGLVLGVAMLLMIVFLFLRKKNKKQEMDEKNIVVKKESFEDETEN